MANTSAGLCAYGGVTPRILSYILRRISPATIQKITTNVKVRTEKNTFFKEPREEWNLSYEPVELPPTTLIKHISNDVFSLRHETEVHVSRQITCLVYPACPALLRRQVIANVEPLLCYESLQMVLIKPRSSPIVLKDFCQPTVNLVK